MIEMVISRQDVLNVVVRDLDRMVVRKVRLFFTYLTLNGSEVTFQTTSKDIHLRIGELSQEGLKQFAEVILKLSDQDGMLLFENEERSKAMLATVTERAGFARVITLSPAH